MKKDILILLANAFPLWVLVASLFSLYRPPLFTWFSGDFITWGLGIIMLGMGITLRVEDFKRVFKYPQWVCLGFVLQYTVMPFLGWSLGYLFDLPTPLAVGLTLVASCPGGTASNVITYLAKADVALSVTMTTVSTILAVIMTPLLTAWLAGSRISVDALGLFLSTVKVVIMPVVVGVLMNKYLPKTTKRILPFAPLVAVIFITLIVASIVGSGRDEIIHVGWRLILAVFSLHALGFLFGYTLAHIFTRYYILSRTISIEVGMQNSGLGVVLARENFPTHPLVAIPCAISSVFHSLIASMLAALWRRTGTDAIKIK